MTGVARPPGRPCREAVGLISKPPLLKPDAAGVRAALPPFVETALTVFVAARRRSHALAPARLHAAPMPFVRHKMLMLAVLAAMLLLALAGCADKRGGSIPYEVGKFNAPDPVAAIAAENAYRTGPGDTLAILVVRVPDLSGEATVDPSGDITLPLLGKLAAIGKTTDQLGTEIAAKLSAKYLQNPEVHVALKSSSSQRITVDGAIAQPGIYPIAGSTTLLQAIAQAKGTTADANARKVAVFRTINGQRQAAAFDLTDIRRGKAADPPIYGNDIIVVDGSVTRARFRDLLQTLPLISLFRPF